MALIKELKGITPIIGEDCYLAESAAVIGDVIMGDQCSIWFNAVVRGDVNKIRMGDRVNVQDGVIIHGTYLEAATSIASNVSIGHGAIIHGCTINERVLIGMGAIVMDHAIVNSNSIIAAGAVVLENTIVEEGSIYAGTPAGKVKQLTEEQMVGIIDNSVQNYLKYMKWYEK